MHCYRAEAFKSRWPHRSSSCRRVLTWALLVCCGLPIHQARSADPAIEVECFTEPYRQIEVAAPEMGILAQILVAEGHRVNELQVLAKLDAGVLEKSLEVARAAKDASGSLRAALSELQTTQNQLESYHSLRRNSNATDREMQRATTAVAVAEAKVQIVRDEMEVRRTEYARTQAQLEKRQIKSPINGTVIEIKKDVGEFVSPSEPVIMTIVDLTELKAIFSLPYRRAAKLHAGQFVSLDIDGYTTGKGVVEFVSPRADPQSGTVRVKIRIDNSAGNLPCGVLCRWDGTATDGEQRLIRSPAGLQR